MKYDMTCSASGMFVANGVMSFNELWRKSLYNFKQRVTKSNNFIVNHVYNFTRATSKIWKNSDHCTFCKYVIVICRSYTSRPTCYYVLVFFILHHDVRMYDFVWAYSA